VSAGYLRNVNVTNTHITNITKVTNNYYHNNFAGMGVNRNIPGAVTAAPKSAFTSGAAIGKVGTVVLRSGLNSGQLIHSADVMPTRESVLGGNTPTRITPPASATRGNVVTQARPPQGPARFDSAQSMAGRTNAPATSGTMNSARGPNTAAATPGSLNSARGANAAPAANLGNSSHNVPRPPWAGGTPANNQVARETVPSNPAAHNNQPASNDSLGRGNSNTMNNHAPTTGMQQSSPGASTVHNNPVPRPPANYTYHPPSATAPQSAPSHQSAPSQHATPQGNSHEGSHSGSSATSRADGSAPRPPAGYSYHAAPAYGASSSYAAGRAGVSVYGARSPGSYPSSSYSGSTARSSGSSPTYTARSYGSPGPYSAPHYSAPSAPHYSSGGGGYRASGGGSYHSGGGGGHSSGGGHR
jgi:hypothetical protein